MSEERGYYCKPFYDLSVEELGDRYITICIDRMRHESGSKFYRVASIAPVGVGADEFFPRLIANWGKEGTTGTFRAELTTSEYVDQAHKDRIIKKEKRGYIFKEEARQHLTITSKRGLFQALAKAKLNHTALKLYSEFQTFFEKSSGKMPKPAISMPSSTPVEKSETQVDRGEAWGMWG